MSNQLTGLLTVKLTDYAAGYVKEWMDENDIDAGDAVDQIISSVRRTVEEEQ